MAFIDAFRGMSTADTIMMAVGFCGQGVFMMRFVVQWIATERRRQVTVPLAFWYLSLGGSLMLLIYAVYLRNPVFIAGFSLNMIIYLRNLYFARRPRPSAAAAAVTSSDQEPPRPS